MYNLKLMILYRKKVLKNLVHVQSVKNIFDNIVYSRYINKYIAMNDDFTTHTMRKLYTYEF